jgi:hypothetical protein
MLLAKNKQLPTQNLSRFEPIKNWILNLKKCHCEKYKVIPDLIIKTTTAKPSSPVSLSTASYSPVLQIIL